MSTFDVKKAYEEKYKKGSSSTSSSEFDVLERYNQYKRYNTMNTDAVNEDYINKFVSDTNSFFNGVGNYSLGYGDATGSLSDLTNRYDTIRAYLYKNRSNLGDEAFTKLTNDLSPLQAGFDSVRSFYSNFDSEDSYNAWYEGYKKKKEIMSAEDFEKYSQIGANIKNPTYAEADGSDNFLGWKNPFKDGAKINNIVTFSKDNIEAIKRSISGANSNADLADVTGNYLYGEFLDDDEVAIYNYYLGKGDTGKAAKYLNSLEDTLYQRHAGSIFKGLDDNWLLEYAFGVGAGLDQFVSGMQGLFAEGPTTPSATQYVSGMIRDDLGSSGPKLPDLLGGASIGQMGYDVVTTTSNMLPSILTSAVTGLPSVGAITLGASAAGNAKTEMLNLGYSQEQATTYGILVGVAEGGMEHLIGGIDDLGGQLLGKGVSFIASKVDNALARVAIKLGNKGGGILKAIAHGSVKLAGNMASEGLEEGLQEVIDPWLREISTGVDWDAPNIDEVLYSSLLGALSAAGLEGTRVVWKGVNTYQGGRAVQGVSGGVGKLQDIGKSFPIDSVAYKIADKVNEKTDVYTIGQLLYEVGGTITKQNLSDITNSLVNKGVSRKDAKKLAKQYMAILDSGMELSDKGRKILELIETTIGKNTEVYQRTKEYYDLLASLDGQASTQGERGGSEDGNASANQSMSESKFEALREASKKYGAQAKAMENTYTEGQDVAKFDKAYGIAYEMGKNGVKPEYVMKSKSTSYLTEMQRELAYEAGKAAADRVSADAKAEGLSRGRATMTDAEGETREVTVKKISSISDGSVMLELEDGKTVNSSDVYFESEDEGALYEAAVKLGLNAEGANDLISAYYESGSAISAEKFASGIAEAYTFGKYGIGPNEMTEEGSAAAELTEKQRSLAYELGKKDADRTAAAKQKEIDAKKEASKGDASAKNDRKKSGWLYYDGINKKGLTERQKVSAKALEVVAKALGVNVHLYESSRDSDGNRTFTKPDGKVTRANGWYDTKTGDIYIDINSGVGGDGVMLFTAAHELVHDISVHAPAKFKILADFLMEQYGKKGVSVDELVQAQTDKAKRNGRDIDYDTAYEEVIADSCESLLSDGEVIQKLAELRARDEGLFEKIKSFITNLVARIKKNYAGMNPDSYEGNIVRKMVDEAERLKELFADALIDASEARASGAKIEIAGRDIMYSDSDSAYSDYDKPITQGDIQKIRDVAAAHGGKRVSINDFTSADIEATQKWAHKFYQELGTKSPFFRAWFGDWRAHERSEINTVTVNNIDLEDVVMQNGDYSNEDTGWSIHAGMTLRDETNHYARGEKISVKALNDIQNIIRNAVLLDTEISSPDSNKKSPNTAFMHKLYAPIIYNGKPYIAKISVEEFFDEGTETVKRKGYHLVAIKIEAAGGNYVDFSTNVPRSDTASIDSISDLHDLVKRYDKDFSPKSVNPVLLNEDGTPKVFYHGTSSRFTSFDIGEASPREGSFFFAENREDAAAYGNHVMEVYLTAEKLADYDNQPSEFYKLKNKRAQVEYLKKRGYDGWYADMDSGGWGEVSVFSPTQVKSATDNIGTFDKANDDIMYSDRDSESFSSRSLLANALESTVQNDIERAKLDEYKSKIQLFDAEQKKLSDLRAKIKELSFAKGKRDTEAIKQLQLEANRTANRINIYDSQLLRLESTQALKNVLQREKQKAYKRAEQKGKQALDEYREKAAKARQQMKEHYQESRKKAVEGRNKTAMRRKIKKVVAELNSLLKRGTKERNVKEGLRDTAAAALASAEILFSDDVTNEMFVRHGMSLPLSEKEGAFVAEYTSVLNEIDEYEKALDKLDLNDIGAGEKRREYLDEMSKLHKRQKVLDGKLSEAFERERVAYNQMTTNKVMLDLAKAYAQTKTAEEDYIRAAYDDYVRQHIESLAELLKDEPIIRDMSAYSLEKVYKAYAMVLHGIKHADKAFKTKKGEKISVIGGRVMVELHKLKQRSQLRLEAVEKAAEFIWNNYKPIYAFERMGSDTLTECFNNIRAGEDVWARDVSEAAEFRDKVFAKYKFKSWNFKKRFEFTSNTGRKFSLSLDQIMTLYAYSKREQAADHLRIGGFVYDGKTKVKAKTNAGVEMTYNLKDPTAYNISAEVLADIVKTMDEFPGAREFVDDMQEYFTVMGDKGNEVSLDLHGVKLFKENNYCPIESASQYLERAREQAKGEVKIKNKGFTKETTPHASNPIVLHSFMDLWASHVNEMSMYHAFVLPLEDFYRVYNYSMSNTEDTDATSVVSAIEAAHGEGAVKYIDQLLKDLNGGAVSDSRETVVKALISSFKKAAVMLSLSVVIQQPSAIVRAMAYINPKYFAGKKVTAGKHKEVWAEIKKYAPVAFIKEMGYFDTGIGRGAVEWLKGENTLMDKIDDAVSKAPELADELTWCAIWNAVKRETLHTNKNLRAGSEEFLNAVGERFTEVIVKTQVYDSTLSRSANMRSKSGLMNMATAFMAEPTTSINMLQDAISKRDGKLIAKTLGAVYGSVVLNSALVSIVYAMRDDDEDETFLEKYLSRFVSEVIDGANPLTYFPFVKDIWSALQGFDVERSDMTLITKLADALQQLHRVAIKDTSDMDEEELSEHKKSVVEAVLGVTDYLAALAGVPVKNVRRDINGIINGIRTFYKDATERDTTWGSLGDAIGDEVKSTLPVLGWVPGKSKGDKLYNAILMGDDAYADRLKDSYESESAYNAALRKALRDNDKRIKEAAIAKNSGNISEYKRIANEIIAEGFFSQDDVVAAINAEAKALRNN